MTKQTEGAMDVRMVPIGSVKPYERNPRRNADAVDAVVSSIRAFGWRQPIVVDEHNVVIVGHTRLLAAKKLKQKTVPVHVATDLTPEQVRAYRLADNRVAENAEWNDVLLALELGELRDDDALIEATGFTDDELARLLDGMDDEPAAIDATAPALDDQYICAVTCEDERSLQSLYEELTHRGYRCKLIL